MNNAEQHEKLIHLIDVIHNNQMSQTKSSKKPE